MWLWYLELYLLTAVAFGVGALVGLVAVRVAVRRRDDDPLLGSVVPPTAETAAASPDKGAVP